jgi:hypothetical protein
VELIDEKNRGSKISCHCLFKCLKYVLKHLNCSVYFVLIFDHNCSKKGKNLTKLLKVFLKFHADMLFP